MRQSERCCETTFFAGFAHHNPTLAVGLVVVEFGIVDVAVFFVSFAFLSAVS